MMRSHSSAFDTRRLPAVAVAFGTGLTVSMAPSATSPAPLAAQEAREVSPRLGSVDFPTSGAPAAQEHFLTGLLYLHSFEYGPAAAEFRKAQALDEDFAARVEAANAQQSVLRYVGRIENGHCKVSVDVVPKQNPLGSIRNGENALVLHSLYYQPIPLVLRGYGAGAEVTAAGVFGDLLRTAWRPLDL